MRRCKRRIVALYHHGRFNHGGGVSQCPCPGANAPAKGLSVAPLAGWASRAWRIVFRKEIFKTPTFPNQLQTPLLSDSRWWWYCHTCVTRSHSRKRCARETNWCYLVCTSTVLYAPGITQQYGSLSHRGSSIVGIQEYPSKN